VTGFRLSGMLVWLTVLWVALWGDLSVANVLSGLVVALVVLAVARQPRLIRRGTDDDAHVSPLAMAHFGLYVLYKLGEANLILAWEIIRPRSRVLTGVVEVPLRTESELVRNVVANVVTLTPGTVTLEVQAEPPALSVSSFFLDDLDGVRRDTLRIEELAVRAFGSPVERRRLAEHRA
jgi:multicomponent Na+:H+ antiporter subunit E